MMDVDLRDPSQLRALSQATLQGKIKSLSGQRICFTGTLSMSRTEMKALVAALGGFNSVSVSETTTLLVARDPYSRTAKAEDARRYGIPIMSEKQFTDMLTVKSP